MSPLFEIVPFAGLLKTASNLVTERSLYTENLAFVVTSFERDEVFNVVVLLVKFESLYPKLADP